MNTRIQFERSALTVFAIILLAIAAGCGGPLQGKKSGKALSDAPAETAALYQSRCLSCHGSELQGRVGSETNLQQIGSRLSADEIAVQIRDGGQEGLMPAFGDQLTEEEIKGLADWLASKQ
ncbi:cytochrome c [Paenibacillus sp. LHD-117]|uniref:c-type cytochrome n=1 Tax=Paenibacillus sp. LHD-117 TaxID=3071412 RepID=UPI0027E0A907|nr:cytochrome c [Paenibacillus sp. LHD-117]MDQ6421180.1 cytochrome c [Paenibacillus sp. LHD-117]